ncbi:MAG TPA: outer membrane protein transport protein [Kofleriaceae bacterium]|nr:outer membrane protein transport protein [Kofleriaceae bacterium]
MGGELGHPATDNPTAVYFNPAAMTLELGTHLYVEGIFVYRTGSYFRPQGDIDHLGEGTPDEALDANSGRAELHNVLWSPFIGVVSDLGGKRDLRVGAAFSVPFGGQVSWDRNDAYVGNQQYPGAEDGVQRWNIIEGQTRFEYMTAAAAYRLRAAHLSLGAGFNLIRATLTTIRARTPEANDDLVSAAGDLIEGRSMFEGAAWTASVSLGALYEPNPHLAVGLSYQSVPGFGEIGLKGTLTNRFNTTTDTPAEMRETFPDIYRLGMRWRNGKMELRASGDYTRWRVMEYQCLLSSNDPARKCSFNVDGSLASDGSGVLTSVDRDLHDTFGLRVGGSYQVTPKVNAFAGVSFDSNAVPDETLEASLIDANKVIVSGGARFPVLRDRLYLTTSLTHVEYARRKTDPRPRDADGEPLLQTPSLNPDGAGRYNTRLELLTIGAEYQF